MKKTVKSLYLRLLTKRSNTSWKVISSNPIQLEGLVVSDYVSLWVHVFFYLKSDSIEWRRIDEPGH